MRFRIQTVLVDLGSARMGDQQLTANEAGVIEELRKAGGDTVSRLHLYKEVWGYTRMPRGRAVDFVVMRLRKKLEACGASAEMIPTVRGRGFRLLGVSEDDAADAPVSSPAASPQTADRLPDLLAMDRPVDAFIGRSEELSELQEALSEHPLVTVTGPPGVGKSRLVLEHLIASGEPFIGISSTDMASEREVRARLGAALGTQASGDVTARLADAPMRTVFIDDADFLASQPLQAIPRWLRSAADLRIVVTSRRPLGVRGERLLRLAPLPVTDAQALFLQRAAEVDVDISPSELETVDAVIDALDSLPLALELAASRLRVLDLAGLQTALSQRFQLLRRRGGGSSLLGALESSWRALSASEQAALTRLCCLRGAFTLDECAAALEGLEGFWIDLLESLVDHSLVQHLGEADGRFRTLWSVSAFVEESAEFDDRAVARQHVAGLLSTTDWGSRRLPDLLAAARWPEAGAAAQACRYRALRVGLRTGRFAAARDALAVGGASASPADIQALSLLARLAAGPSLTEDAADTGLDRRVQDALLDTAACLRWSTSEPGETPREQLADCLEAARRAVEAGDWSAALEAYEDGLDHEGGGHDFGLLPLQLVRMLSLGRLGRPVASRVSEIVGLAQEAQDTGMSSCALTSLLLAARFHRDVPDLTALDAIAPARIGLDPAGRASLDRAWALAGA